LKHERHDDGHKRRGGEGERDSQAQNHLKSIDFYGAKPDPPAPDPRLWKANLERKRMPARLSACG
jgi:hypothetical protein